MAISSSRQVASCARARRFAITSALSQERSAFAWRLIAHAQASIRTMQPAAEQQRAPALQRRHALDQVEASTARNTRSKNASACSESIQRTTSTMRRVGSIQVKELPAPIAKQLDAGTLGNTRRPRLSQTR